MKTCAVYMIAWSSAPTTYYVGGVDHISGPKMTIARSLRQVARAQRPHTLILSRSQDLVCKNIMCENVGEPCVCKLSLALERVPDLLHLDLSENQLTCVPESAFVLTQLVHLNISGNRITSLPRQLMKLSNLRELNIANNRIALLDEFVLSRLPELKEIRVTGNPLTSNTLEILRAIDGLNVIE